MGNTEYVRVALKVRVGCPKKLNPNVGVYAVEFGGGGGVASLIRPDKLAIPSRLRSPTHSTLLCQISG